DTSRVAIRTKDGQALARWTWRDPSPSVSFGDPTASTDFQLCIETTAAGYTGTVPHGSAWRATRSGFRYRSASGTVRSLDLKSTATKTMIRAAVIPDALPPLPATTMLRIRLLRPGATPTCFEAEFAHPRVNTATRYIATH